MPIARLESVMTGTDYRLHADVFHLLDDESRAKGSTEDAP